MPAFVPVGGLLREPAGDCLVERHVPDPPQAVTSRLWQAAKLNLPPATRCAGAACAGLALDQRTAVALRGDEQIRHGRQGTPGSPYRFFERVACGTPGATAGLPARPEVPEVPAAPPAPTRAPRSSGVIAAAHGFFASVGAGGEVRTDGRSGGARWSLEADRTVRASSAGAPAMCLSAADGRTPLLRECDPSDPAQLWDPDPLCSDAGTCLYAAGVRALRSSPPKYNPPMRWAPAPASTPPPAPQPPARAALRGSRRGGSAATTARYHHQAFVNAFRGGDPRQDPFAARR